MAVWTFILLLTKRREPKSTREFLLLDVHQNVQYVRRCYLVIHKLNPLKMSTRPRFTQNRERLWSGGRQHLYFTLVCVNMKCAYFLVCGVAGAAGGKHPPQHTHTVAFPCCWSREQVMLDELFGPFSVLTSTSTALPPPPPPSPCLCRGLLAVCSGVAGVLLVVRLLPGSPAALSLKASPSPVNREGGPLDPLHAGLLVRGLDEKMLNRLLLPPPPPSVRSRLGTSSQTSGARSGFGTGC